MIGVAPAPAVVSGLDRLTKNVSLASTLVSPFTVTETVLVGAAAVRPPNVVSAIPV